MSKNTLDAITDVCLGPAPERVKKTTWTEFLKIHWDVLIIAPFGYAAQLPRTLRPSGEVRLSSAMTTTRARKCKMFRGQLGYTLERTSLRR